MFWTIVGALIFVALLPIIGRVLFMLFVAGFFKLSEKIEEKEKKKSLS